MYCGLDFQDPNGLLHLSLFLVMRRYHLVCSFDKSQSGEINVGAVELRSFFPITYFAAIDTSNGGIAIFFDMASLKTSATGVEEEEGKGASKSTRVTPGTISESLKGGMLGIRR